MFGMFFLVAAVCADTFAAGMSYGCKKIKIPPLSAVMISGTGAAVLGLSMLLAAGAKTLAGVELCRGISVGILGMMGIIGLIGYFVKKCLAASGGKRRLEFSRDGIEFVILLCLDNTAADLDGSKELSPKEALALSMALSADSVASGFGFGIGGTGTALCAAFALVFGVAALYVGAALGKRFCKSFSGDCFSSAVLLALAAVKLFRA